jgi:hypothetical protein
MLLVCNNSGLAQRSPVEDYPEWIQLDETDDWFPIILHLPFYPTNELGSDLLNQFAIPLNKAVLRLEQSLVNWFTTSSNARIAFQEILKYWWKASGEHLAKRGRKFPLAESIRSGNPTAPQIHFRLSSDANHLIDLIAICCVLNVKGVDFIYRIINKAAEQDFVESEVIKLGDSISVLALTYPNRPGPKILNSIAGSFSLSLCLACSGAYHLSNTIHHQDEYNTAQFVVPHVEPLLTDLISTLERCSSIIEVSNSKQSEI